MSVSSLPAITTHAKVCQASASVADVHAGTSYVGTAIPFCCTKTAAAAAADASADMQSSATQVVVGRTGDQMLTNEAGDVTRWGFRGMC